MTINIEWRTKVAQVSEALREPRILAYHSISRPSKDVNRICTSPERFESHMRYLARRGLRGVSMRELIRAMETGDAGGLIGLTFDDGYEDFLQNAAPILEKFGFTATVFVIVGLIGKKNSWEHHLGKQPEMSLLDSEGVREVARRGMEVGAHTMTHPRLTGLAPDALEEEVAGSRRVLAGFLGEEVEGFCYPYGSIDAGAVEAVRLAGYSYGCTVIERVARNGYDHPRIPISERDDLLRLALKLSIYPQYVKMKRLYPRRSRREPPAKGPF